MKKKLGHEIPCQICGKLRYRTLSQIERGITKTCGDRSCISILMQGEGNPYWGKKHSPEVKEKIKIARSKNPPKGTGPRKGEFKQSPEARAKIAENNRKRWKENRDLMLSYIPRGDQHPFKQLEHEIRHRVKFTPFQKETWLEKECFYCKITENLILDHIIPILAGGTRERHNCQTLCEFCNRWKLRYVDIPIYKSYLGSKGD
jgi:5-methylcytosine-specific restriction endonuclease McrA